MRAGIFQGFLLLFVVCFLESVTAQEGNNSESSSQQSRNLSAQAVAVSVDGDRELPDVLKSQGVFLDQEKEVPARAEWNREIVLKKAGTIMVGVKSGDAKGVIIMTVDAFNKITAGNAHLINKEKDILLVDDTTEDVYKKNVKLPAGRYIVMIENRSKSPQSIRLRCGLVKATSSKKTE